MEKKFDHGSVRLSFNTKRTEAGPGQFKQDPYLVKTVALDSVVKEVIYEANIHNANIPEISKAYTERNKIFVPLLQKLLEIQQERKEKGEPNHREQEEQEAVDTINNEDEKLPTMAQLHELNKTISERILTKNREWNHNKGQTRAENTEKESQQ